MPRESEAEYCSTYVRARVRGKTDVLVSGPIFWSFVTLLRSMALSFPRIVRADRAMSEVSTRPILLRE